MVRLCGVRAGRGHRCHAMAGDRALPPHSRDVRPADAMAGRILVAGIGNIFLGDDGFGVEVVRRLSTMAVPEGVTVADFGIRGIHLAYEMLERYDHVVLIDAR